VTVDNFVRILTGRHEPGMPASKRLMSTNESRVLIYLSGKSLSFNVMALGRTIP
jgi:GPI-anchor transamidase subunit K